MSITSPAPRVYVHGSLRTIRDTAAVATVHAAVVASTVVDDNGTYYAQTSEAVHSQQTDWPVGSDGEWTAELVWAPGVTYQLSCPGFMPDAYLECDTHAAGGTFEADTLLVPPGGGAVVAPLTVAALSALVDAKMSTATSRQAATIMRARYETTDVLKVMTMGDSKAVGAGASTLATSWARVLLATLRSSLGSGDHGYGFMAADNSSPGPGPVPTLGAGAAGVMNNAGLGVRTVVLDNGETVTWPALVCNKITVWYSKSDTLPGTANVKVDGAVVGAIDSTPAPGGPGTFIDSSGHSISFDVAAGSHTVQIVGTAADGTAHVDGVHFQTDPAGVTLYGAAHGGFSAEQYAFGTNPDPAFNIPLSATRCHFEAVAAINPDLVVMAFGANDMQLGAAGAQRWRVALQEVIRRTRLAAPGCGIVLLVGTARLEDAGNLAVVRAYEAAAREAVGNTPGVTILYESDLWLPNATAPVDDVGWLDDLVHPSDFGHALIADHLAAALLRPGTSR